MINEVIDREYPELIRHLRALVSIPSVSCGTPEPGMPLGEPLHEALEYVLSLARRLGFSARSLDGYCGVVDFGEGDEMLMILTHLDVVPGGPGWTSPPFTLTERDGRLIGRGVLDDKGPALCSLYALHAIKEAGIPLRRKVRLFFGCDEERSKSCIRRYKQTEQEPTLSFTPDSRYSVVNSEKNIGHTTYTRKLSGSAVRIACGTAPNVIPGEATALLPFMPIQTAVQNGAAITAQANQLIAVGRGGHGARPEDAQNALSALLYALAQQPLCAEDLDVASSLVALLKFDQHGEGFELDFEDASGRLTLSPTMLVWNETEVSITLDCRFPLGLTAEQVLSRQDAAFSKIGFSRTYQKVAKGYLLDPQCELVSTLLSVYEDATGKKAQPCTISGGTYARYFANAVAFGVEPEGGISQAHMPDESRDAQSLRFDTMLIAEAIRRLAGKIL